MAPEAPGWVGRALGFGGRLAIRHAGRDRSYAELLEASSSAGRLLLAGRSDLEEERVAFLVPAGYDYVRIQRAVWRAGGVAVPLCVSHPPPELEYVLRDSAAETVIFSPEFEEVMAPLASELGLRSIRTGELSTAGSEEAPLPEMAEERRAMIVYTSGSTGPPKGVVTSHANLHAQMESLVEAWEWSAEDRILNVLPLHHVHGIVNVLGCALWCGAACEMMERFEAPAVWRRLASGELTLFMAVPTVYVRLIAAWDEASPEDRQAWSEGAASLRLMVSGSAALPVSVLERWYEITGHRLLERYGMTETGMILSNPLRGDRRPGFVGQPLPGVEVRLRADGGELSETEGEVEVRGRSVFREYWGRPEATREAFREGWFRTGDVARLDEGSYRLLGRSSVDILKTGGYKVSALEIEETLRRHPAIAECAVVGVPDEEWGERVAAAVVCRAGEGLELEELRAWGKQQLAPYKVPTLLLRLDSLPRNALGKVTKPDVVQLFADDRGATGRSPG